MRLLIVEPEATGHHMALYTRFIVSAALRRGWNPQLLTTREAVAHPSFRFVEAASEGRLRVHLMPSVPRPVRSNSFSLLRNQFRRYVAIALGFRRIPAPERPDSIYMVNLDHCDKIMSVLGSPFAGIPFSGMMMSLKFHRSLMRLGPPGRSDLLYEWLFRRLLRCASLRRVAVIDETFLEYAQKCGCREYAKLQFAPDPGEVRGAETKSMARAALGIGPERFVILLYGSLTLRKGVRELLSAVSNAEAGPVAVLLAGTPDSAVEALLREPGTKALVDSGRLFIQLGFHDADREYRAFRAADAVWVGYVGHFYSSSGVFYQAASLGLPVLAPRSGLLGWLVERYGNGLCCDPEDPVAVAALIAKLAGESALRERLAENGRRLARAHTGDRFGDAVCETI